MTHSKILNLPRWATAGTLVPVLLGAVLAPVSLAQTPEPAPSETAGEPAPAASQFVCQLHNGQPTVMYAPASQPGQFYPWAVPQDMGSAWPAQRRCETISARLESYRPDGLLTLDTSVENGYNTVCVTTQAVEGCRIVFTVPQGQDATFTRDQVFENLAIADQGQQTQGINTLTGGSNVLGQIGEALGLPTGGTRLPSRSGGSIGLRPFLDPSDGGTGANLRGGQRTAPSRSLNPDNFR